MVPGEIPGQAVSADMKHPASFPTRPTWGGPPQPIPTMTADTEAPKTKTPGPVVRIRGLVGQLNEATGLTWEVQHRIHAGDYQLWQGEMPRKTFASSSAVEAHIGARLDILAEK